MPEAMDATVGRIERRSLLSPKPEVRADGDKRTLAGFAARFYDGTPATEYELWPGMIERIDPGAFDRALAERDDVRGLVNHQPDNILGRTTAGTMRLEKRSEGLWYEIDLPATQTGTDISVSVERGDVTGSSFSFGILEQRWDETPDTVIRTLMSVRLYDVGPVTFPAYEGTTAAMRADEGAGDALLEYEDWRASKRTPLWDRRKRIAEILRENA